MAEQKLMRRGLFWYYGVGAIPFGVKDNAFSYLLLIYANQCLGIPGWLAGMAMVAALAWDAVTDVIVGHWSDKTHSRLGRRHPFMYVGLVVLPLSFWAMFAPVVELNDTREAFLYVLVLAILIRTGVTLFEVPNVALLPDLEHDYDQRNKWLAMRQFLGWYGGNGAQLINFAFFVGVLGFANPQGYVYYAWFGASVIAVAILISLLGTQKAAAKLPPPTTPLRWREIGAEFRQIGQSLQNRNFAVLFGYSLCFFVAAGLGAALFIYNMRYFFGLSGEQLSFLTLIVFLGPLMGAALAPVLAKRWGKRNVAICSILGFACVYPIPFWMFLNGMWAPLGSWDSAYSISAFIVLETALLTQQGTLIASMMADVVEDSQVKTQRRSEGLFYATRSFANKLISAGGVIGAGIILSLVGFDDVKSLADVTDELRTNLAATYLPFYSALIALGAIVLGFYQIDRSAHEANLKRVRG